MTAEEKEEHEKLETLENEMTATREIFISKDQQRALAQDGDTVFSVESRLTKGDVAPPQADNSIVSALTGETRESKAKAYAAEESKKIAAQYVGTISALNSKFKESDKKVETLQSDLATALKALAAATSKFNLGSEERENSGLSSDLSRSSAGVDFIDKSRSSMDLSSENEDVDDDDVSDQIPGTLTSTGQDLEEHGSTDNEIKSPPSSPFMKKKDNKDTFIRDEESVKKRSPKKGKYITPDKAGRRTSSRLTPPKPTPITKAPITNEGDGISL